ncbi:MAG: hypothetical protein EHM81_08830, partial [Chloroflexi bacterium]
PGQQAGDRRGEWIHAQRHHHHEEGDVDPDELRADKLIDDIHRQRKLAFKEREKADKARGEVHKLRRELAERLEKIEDERREVMATARAEAELEVEVIKRNIGRLKADLKKLRQPLEALEKIEQKVELVEEKVATPVERQTSKVESQPQPVVFGALKLGEKVLVRTLGSEGIITALGESEAEVQVGSLRIRARLTDIQRKSAADEPSADEKVSGRTRRIQKMAANLQTTPATAAGFSAPGLELDLRGQNSEDALVKLDNYLDKAYMSGMPYVRIIHGKGTGKLRQEVRAALKGHPQVASYEEGLPNEGGDGVTVAKMVKE